MIATPNSGVGGGWRSFQTLGLIALWIFFAIIIPGRPILGAEAESPGPDFAKRAELIFEKLQKEVRISETNAVATAWQFGRACFDWAEFAEKSSERENIAQQGIAACRRAVALDPDSAPAHYFLAMNLGQLARTKTLGALRIVPEMEKEFLRARSLDPLFDYAGPDRALGVLYREAPGWPTSIGSRKKARQHLERAVELRPDYPENHLELLEAYLGWNDAKSVEREVAVLEELLPKARNEFIGERWEQNWADWEKRWKTLRRQADEHSLRRK